MSPTSFRRAAAVLIPLTLFVSACGSDSAKTVTPATTVVSATTAAAVATTAAAVATTAAAPTTVAMAAMAMPHAIISLSPTATETLFAIGAGKQVIAVDDQSNFPAEAAAVKSTLSGYEPNLEAIAAKKPDLVVIGDDSKGLADKLKSVGIASVVQPPAKTLAEAYAEMDQLGKATGHAKEAADLVGKIKGDIASIVSATKKPTTPISFFHEVDNTGYTATSATFIGELYTTLGLKNVADAVKDTTGYPQMSMESIIAANPKIVFLSDAGYGESADTVKARAGWSAVDAVKTGNIVALDSDISSRWGPRTSDLLKAIATAVTKVAA